MTAVRFKAPDKEFTRYWEKPYDRWAYKRAHKVSRGPRPRNLSEALYWAREGLVRGAAIVGGSDMHAAQARVLALLAQLAQRVSVMGQERNLHAVMQQIVTAWDKKLSPLVPCGLQGPRERLEEAYEGVAILPVNTYRPLASIARQMGEALLDLALLGHKVSMAQLTAMTALHRAHRMLQSPPPTPDPAFTRTSATLSTVRLLPHVPKSELEFPRDLRRCRNGLGVLNTPKALHGMCCIRVRGVLHSRALLDLSYAYLHKWHEAK